MFCSVRLRFGAAIAAAVLLVTPAVQAATVNLSFDSYNRGQISGARSAMSSYLTKASNLHVDTFESAKSGTYGALHTNVGRFTTVGAAGSGHSVVGSGAELAVRGDNTMKWGRYNTDGHKATTALGGQWLDSNDNLGVSWTVSGLGKFDTLAFFVTDVADVGGTFSIKVGDTMFSSLAGSEGRLRNGNIHLVKVALSEAVDKLTITLMHDRTNDGFGIDGAAVGRIAPVPLPPAAALLLTGVAGLAGMAGLRRRGTRGRTSGSTGGA
jgi:hypothetical protein